MRATGQTWALADSGPPDGPLAFPVAEWQKTFEEKLQPLFSVRESLSEEEALKMGKRDPEQEVENFVTANTLELGKDKWQCPLSGKKFKVRLLPRPLPWDSGPLPGSPAPDPPLPLSPRQGPEFVHKHIFNKHAEKIEEVKKEVAFFNNFLMDAKRPALPEFKLNQTPVPGQGELGGGGLRVPAGVLGVGEPPLPSQPHIWTPQPLLSAHGAA